MRLSCEGLAEVSSPHPTPYTAWTSLRCVLGKRKILGPASASTQEAEDSRKKEGNGRSEVGHRLLQPPTAPLPPVSHPSLKSSQLLRNSIPE